MFGRRPRPAPVEATRDYALDLPDGAQVQVRQRVHAAAKRLRITVDDDGVRVTVPVRATQEQVDAFVQQHLDWIDGHWARIAPAPVEAWVPGVSTHLPLRAAELPVRWSVGKVDRVRCVDGRFDVQVRRIDAEASPALRRALRDFYVAEARADVARWLPMYLGGLPRAPTRIVFKAMRSQWGSMSTRGHMALDTALVLGDSDAFHYVLVHELCHLLHHDHSPAYWREVDLRFADRRTARDYLRAQGAALKRTFRALTHA